MKIIIDTHIFLWSLSEPGKINTFRRSELETLTNTIYVSSITITELMIKASIGKLELNFDPVDMAVQTGFELLDFSACDALLLRDMPFHHKDPFDRMLIAQAMVQKCPIMTDDRKMEMYGCQLL